MGIANSSKSNEVLTVRHRNQRLFLKKVKSHSITLKSLFADDDADTDDGHVCHTYGKYWKTLGRKYLSIDEQYPCNSVSIQIIALTFTANQCSDDNQLLLKQSKLSTKFLYSLVSPNPETFYLCAVHNNGTYLVSPSNEPSIHLGKEKKCEVPCDPKIDKQKYRFVSVYYKVSDERFSDEIQTFSNTNKQIGL